MSRLVTPENFGQNPHAQANLQMGMDIQRIAVGLDMLVGLLSEYLGYDLKETKDEHGNIVLRWRPRGAEAPESEGEESADSQA